MFKRRAGLGGLRIVIGPMRREDPATGAGASGTDPAAGGAPASTPPSPAATPPAGGAPAPVDVTSTPEFKAALAQAKADADAKARTGSKDNARTEILDQIAQALGIKPKDVDPAQVAQDLVKERQENARLLTESAVGRAARGAGGDEDMVTAWLSHKGKLAGLDPKAADFDAKVEALVKAEIEANPKLAAATAPAGPTPGTAGAGSSAMGGGAGGTGRVLGLGNALAAAQKR